MKNYKQTIATGTERANPITTEDLAHEISLLRSDIDTLGMWIFIMMFIIAVSCTVIIIYNLKGN